MSCARVCCKKNKHMFGLVVFFAGLFIGLTDGASVRLLHLVPDLSHSSPDVLLSSTDGDVAISEPLVYAVPSPYFALNCSHKHCMINITVNAMFSAITDDHYIANKSFNTIVLFGDHNDIEFVLLKDSITSPSVDDVNAGAIRIIDVSTASFSQNNTVSRRSTYCQGCAQITMSTLSQNGGGGGGGGSLEYAANNDYDDVGIVAWPIEFTLTPRNQAITKQLGYQGTYTMILYGNETMPESLWLMDYAPEDWWLPIVIGAAVLVALFVISQVGLCLVPRIVAAIKQQQSQPPKDVESALLLGTVNNADAADTSSKPKKERLQSLDTFRGGCLAVMIFVNYGGGGYWFFDHSYWNGLTLADLVFPWFIFIMGSSMALSLQPLLRRSQRSTIVFKIIKRSVLLFCLGLFLNNGHQLNHWRIPGVLQYFAFSYLVCSLVIVFLPVVGDVHDDLGEPSLFADIVPFLLQWIVILIFPLVHLAVTFGLNVPGCGRGYLGPGGLADDGKYWSCVGGASTYVDHWFFHKDHTYQYPTCQDFYQCGAHDPEGMLGAFNAVFLCWLGVQCGRIFGTHKAWRPRCVRLLVWGSILLAIGCALCGAKRDGGIIPVNKNLWSISFITVLAGGANVVLCLCFLVIDVVKKWNGMPFRALGMNSIVIYCGHELLGDYFPFSFAAPAGHGWQLFSNMLGASVWVLIAYLLFVNNTFFNL